VAALGRGEVRGAGVRRRSYSVSYIQYQSVFRRFLPCGSHLLSFVYLGIFTQVKWSSMIQAFVFICIIVRFSFPVTLSSFPSINILNHDFFTVGFFALLIYNKIRKFRSISLVLRALEFLHYSCSPAGKNPLKIGNLEK
jgi:hypothetical protein